ncbi:MAG: PEP-CTERM sorting domain-containing protein [Deltaproteobacteria bacterium]|nr:PEP-CTERM sorting domain-containing protein [Deltaproteobacteria bacterium]
MTDVFQGLAGIAMLPWRGAAIHGGAGLPGMGKTGGHRPLPAALSVALLVLLFSLPGLPASALSVTLNDGGSSYLTATADDQSGAASTESVIPVAVPYVYTSTNVDGGASSEADYNLYNTSFAIGLDHSRPVTLGSFGQSYGSIFFSVDENVGYTALGSYAATDSDGRRVRFEGSLYDFTAGEYLFRSVQESRSTANESFTLGLAEGDFLNVDTGLLTGTLVAGQAYKFQYNVLLQANPSGAASSATGTGSLSLTFPALVPEPSTALLLAAGLVGLAHRRRHQSR